MLLYSGSRVCLCDCDPGVGEEGGWARHTPHLAPTNRKSTTEAQPSHALRSTHLMFTEAPGWSRLQGSQDGAGLLLLEGVGGGRDAHEKGVTLGLLCAELQQVGSCLGYLQTSPVSPPWAGPSTCPACSDSPASAWSSPSRGQCPPPSAAAPRPGGLAQCHCQRSPCWTSEGG